MARLLLLLTLVVGPLFPAGLSLHWPDKQVFSVGAAADQQSDPPLTQSQIEDFLKVPVEDEILAGEIRKSGLGFRVTPQTLDLLKKKGAGPRTRQALLEWEARAAYAEFTTEKDPTARLGLGTVFLQRHPDSPAATNVRPELRKIELELFEAAFQAFSATPDLAGLEKLLRQGRDLLGRYSDHTAEVQVKVRLALATSKGLAGGFYSDLEQSRAYARQAQTLLNNATPPPGVDPQSYGQLRANSLGMIYQSLGHLLLRQPLPEPEQAIGFLTQAAEAKESASANDPFTYFLRASARNLMVKRLNDEYLRLPKAERAGRQGRLRCGAINELVKQLSLDYSQTLYLSGLNNAPQLKEEAANALLELATSERPCLGGRSGPIAEWPGEDKRAALVIGVEDYFIDKQVGKFSYAASDARAVAEALIRYGGFRKEQVVLLTTGEPADRQPLRNVILQQLAELPNRLPQDGLLLVYFVGHAAEKAGKTFLLAADSSAANESRLSDTAISLERLREEIKKSGAGQAVLIFDAFRQTPVSETFSRQLSFDVRKNEVSAFATLLAASTGERSYDSPAKKHGQFTSMLLEAAQGKAADKSGDVTLEKLINYLQAKVPQEVQREQPSGVQHPSYKAEGYDEETLVVFSSDSGGQPAAQKSTSNVAALARNSSTIFVRSKTIFLNKTVLEAELRKLPEFQASKLKIVSDAKDADLIVEITLPALTWEWNYRGIHRASNTTLFSDKRKGLTDSSVSPNLAKDIVKALLDAQK